MFGLLTAFKQSIDHTNNNQTWLDRREITSGKRKHILSCNYIFQNYYFTCHSPLPCDSFPLCYTPEISSLEGDCGVSVVTLMYTYYVISRRHLEHWFFCCLIKMCQNERLFISLQQMSFDKRLRKRLTGSKSINIKQMPSSKVVLIQEAKSSQLLSSHCISVISTLCGSHWKATVMHILCPGTLRAPKWPQCQKICVVLLVTGGTHTIESKL